MAKRRRRSKNRAAVPEAVRDPANGRVMYRTQPSKKPSWFTDHRRALKMYAKSYGLPEPTAVELDHMTERANQIMAHRIDRGHYPDRTDIAQRCYLCEQKLTDKEQETARSTVDTASFLHPKDLKRTAEEQYDGSPFFAPNGERRTAEETVKFLDPPQTYTDPKITTKAGSLEALHTELAELTHRLGVATKKIAAASLALE